MLARPTLYGVRCKDEFGGVLFPSLHRQHQTISAARAQLVYRWPQSLTSGRFDHGLALLYHSSRLCTMRSPSMGIARLLLPARLLVPGIILGAALTTLAWAYLIRRLGLLSVLEVPLLYQSRHAPVRLALRYLAPLGRS